MLNTTLATVTSEVDCGLCLQSYPRQLPCSHSFCLSCIRQLVQSATDQPGSSGGSGGAGAASGSFSCPTCLSPTDISLPLRGASDGRGTRNSAHATAGFDWEVAATGSPPSWPPRKTDTPRFSVPPGSGWDLLASGSCGGSLSSCSDRSGHSTSSSQSSSGAPLSISTSGVEGRGTCRSAAEEEDSLRMTTTTRMTTVVPERTCRSHPGEQLRFYCTRCSSVICRDCKQSSHEGHPSEGLLQKSQDVQSLVSTVTEMSLASLRPKLKQSLRDVDNHRKLTDSTETKIRATLQRRADHLKEVVDQALAEALDQLDRNAAAANRRLSAKADDMTQGLVSLVSFAEHVQSVADKGCQADVVELLPQLRQFFQQAVTTQKTTEEFEILEEDCSTAPESGDISEEAFAHVELDGVLGPFLGEDWRLILQLSDPTSRPTIECPFCSCKYSADISGFSCPKCCSTKSGSSSRCCSPKKLFGLRGGGRSAERGPQLQCQSCCLRYSATFAFCPSCCLSPSQDALSNVKTFVPQYLGCVTETHQSVGREGSGRRSPRVQEISNIITTLGKLLDEFQ